MAKATAFPWLKSKHHCIEWSPRNPSKSTHSRCCCIHLNKLWYVLKWVLPLLIKIRCLTVNLPHLPRCTRTQLPFSLVRVVPIAKEEKKKPQHPTHILYYALRWAVLEQLGSEWGLTTSSSALQKPPARSSSRADLPLGSPATVMTIWSLFPGGIWCL